MVKKISSSGKDYGYGQLEGSYIKPQKIDGKYYVRDQSFNLQEIPRPVGKSSDFKNSVASKRLDAQVYGRTMPKGTQPSTFRGAPSILEGLKSFIRGGGLRSGGK